MKARHEDILDWFPINGAGQNEAKQERAQWGGGHLAKVKQTKMTS